MWGVCGVPPPPPPQPHYLSVPSLRNNHVRGKDCANLKFLIKTICLAISHKHSYCLISSAVAWNDPSFCQPLPPPPIKCTAAPSPPFQPCIISLFKKKNDKEDNGSTSAGWRLACWFFFLFCFFYQVLKANRRGGGGGGGEHMFSIFLISVLSTIEWVPLFIW